MTHSGVLVLINVYYAAVLIGRIYLLILPVRLSVPHGILSGQQKGVEKPVA